LSAMTRFRLASYAFGGPLQLWRRSSALGTGVFAASCAHNSSTQNPARGET
jgi:hypothetical protein